MNRALVDKLARALLYEGYILYPYRPSVKNQQRWTFGGVYPPSWSEAQEGTDACAMQTQILLEPGPAAVLRISARFLHLMDRTVGRLSPPLDELPAAMEPEFQLVQSLEVGGKQYQAWQEAVEREVDLGEINVRRLLARPLHKTFSFPYQRTIQPLRSTGGVIVAIVIRRQEAIEGTIELSATAVEENLIRICVRILNRTELAGAKEGHRDDALMRALVSTHTILEAKDGKFVSLTDPPDRWRQHASQCVNIGAWPVMVGSAAECDTMLSSPIIVEDYPKIAPQSPGDLFDSTEIDEILTLRIMTLTDEEKRIASGVDDRVRDLMARTQSLARDELMGLHGTLREVAPSFEQPNDYGSGLKVGDRVWLRPLGRADVMDIALDGKAATIVSIEQDFENRVHVAVTVDDDPGKDLGLRGQPGHRFFFGIDEVELIDRAEAAK
jgi:hydrogenase maturation protease